MVRKAASQAVNRSSILRVFTKYNKYMNLYKEYKKKEYFYKKWFWRANYPVAIALYFLTDDKILLFYTLLCSVYANEETSASAEEAEKAQN
jgi:hypothetical protein